MNGLQHQPAWKSPFSNQKFHETRTFFRSLTIKPDLKDSEDFLKWHRIQIDAGHSLGFSSTWSLLLVSCGYQNSSQEVPSNNADVKQNGFSPVDVDYLGLFLDDIHEETEITLHSDSDSTRSRESEYETISSGKNNQEGVSYEFVARCSIEVLGNDNNNVITSRELETPPRESITKGYWGWKKVNSIPYAAVASSAENSLDKVLNLRIIFTISGNRKDALTKIPSSHVNLMAREHFKEGETALSIYNLTNGLDLKLNENEFNRMVILETASSSDKRFLVHKYVLSCRSEVFARMFGTSMKESRTNRVKIPDISLNTMDCLLRHLYTGQTETEWLSDPKVATELVNAAEKYWLGSLLNFCDKNLVQAANTRNCLQLLELASIHDLEKATDDLTQYVIEKMRQSEELHTQIDDPQI